MKREGGKAAEAPRAGRKRVLSPLTRRVLAVNVIALVIPIVGLLYLGPYRESLIEAELEALRRQGEIFSGALGESAIETLNSGQQVLNHTMSRNIIRRLTGVDAVRARLFLVDGSLAADSRLLGALGGLVQMEELLPPENGVDGAMAPILDLLDRFAQVLAKDIPESYSEKPIQTAADYREAAGALYGEVAGVVRKSRDGGLVMSVALPVQRYRQVIGALMLSKDGSEVEAALRNVRLTVLAVFAGALVVTVMLSLYLAGTIARPLHRLAEAAERVRRTIGRDDEQIPDFTGRGDEIGDLSGVLREMTDALRQRMLAIEGFAADVSHEIKNPLTSLRSAVETASRVRDPEQQQKLMAIVLEDVQRLDRLITDISDASRLDAELGRAETAPVDVAQMLAALAEIRRAAEQGEQAPQLDVRVIGPGPFVVEGVESRLVQVFRNLIGNAVSFSPPGGRITVTVDNNEDQVVITVEDEGPGIPQSKLEAIFDRFYSERPSVEKFGIHSGLGLSISKQILEAHGGGIRAENRPGPGLGIAGARLVVWLPLA